MSLTIRFCVAISFSSGGPSHLMLTPSSLPARSAPALTDFQNTWVVPLGTTPIVLPDDEDDAEPPPPPPPESFFSHADNPSSSIAPQHAKQSTRLDMSRPPRTSVQS